MGQLAKLGVLAGRCAFVVLLAAPVFLYIKTFGTEISSDHQRWAEMGSAMSGIYGPIVALLAFVALLRQLRLQRQSTEMQLATTEHMLQQTFIQDARNDIYFYLNELLRLLDKEADRGLIPRFVLQSKFQDVSLAQLESNDLHEFATAIDACCPQLKAIWLGFYTIVDSLGTIDKPPYNVNRVLALQKALALLSNRTCSSMDNYLYCVTKGRVSSQYKFSDVVSAS